MTTDNRLEWRTSSYSSNGENCVEVAPAAGWHDSKSVADGGDRASIAFEQQPVFVRHSKVPEAGVIEFSPASWMAFIQEASEGTRSRNGSATVTFDGTDTLVEARDTGVRLRFDDGEWAAFLAGIKDGEFDVARFAR
ncbi:DUF397 domain-containing protein [Nocardia jiangxiensis]|uniref:DUF397 domain-containing protein n=1 Tax=Nocardia jiangxiensis TaxID=282685 RepID=UPI000592D2F7|nr:DUF397 domain-containing protein [Nocardia jiangxiensis]